MVLGVRCLVLVDFKLRVTNYEKTLLIKLYTLLNLLNCEALNFLNSKH